MQRILKWTRHLKYAGYQIKEQSAHKYVAIHIERPFDNPFVTIPGVYHTLVGYEGYGIGRIFEGFFRIVPGAEKKRR